MPHEIEPPYHLASYVQKLSGSSQKSISRQLSARLEGADTRFSDDRGTVALFLHVDNSAAYRVGETLMDLDREARRSAAFMTDGSLYPKGSVRSTTLVSGRESESAELVIALLHPIAAVVLSDPVQFAATLHWMWQFRPTRRRSEAAEQRDQLSIVQQLTSSANTAIEAGKNVKLRMAVRTPDSETEIWFETDD